MKIKESNKDTCTSEFLKHLENRGISLKNQELRTIEAANGLMLKLRAQLKPFRCITDDMIPWEEKSAEFRLASKMEKSKPDREADDWRVREITKDIAKRKMEKMKEIAKLKTKETLLVQYLRLQTLFALCSLVFGEGVVNDSTSVVLFNAIQRFDLDRLNVKIGLDFIGNFFYLFVSSTMLGIITGLFSAFIIKKLYFRRHIFSEIVLLLQYICRNVKVSFAAYKRDHYLVQCSFSIDKLIYINNNLVAKNETPLLDLAMKHRCWKRRCCPYGTLGSKSQGLFQLSVPSLEAENV
ncbi:hypothetical protein ACFE04_020909 [Oxalis oulophora]